MTFRVGDMAVPVLLATGIVLGQAAQADGSSWVVLRPLILAALLGAGVYLVMAVIARTRAHAVLGSTAVVALIGGLGLAVVAAVTVAVVVAYWRHIRRQSPFTNRYATAALPVTGIFALVGLIGFVTSQPVLSYPRVEPVIAAADPDLPSIYLILLDGYPRQDMLAEYFGVHNGAFLAALSDRGFDLYPDATANHSLTALALATMFNAATASELAVEATSRPGQFRALHRLLNAGSVWDALRDAGYSIATIPPTPDGVKLVAADVYLDEGQISGFEVHLIENSGLRAIFDFAGVDLIHDHHRSRLEAGFDALPDVPPRGTFLLAHFFLPHRPLVFQADGSPRGEDACQVECTDAEFYPAFAEQLAYTNDRVIEAIDRLPQDAVVVVFSDHGSREPADPREWLRTLLVARTPGQPRLFGDEPQPLTWLSRLLNTYAGTDLPEKDGGHWRSHRLPMDIEAVEP